MFSKIDGTVPTHREQEQLPWPRRLQGPTVAPIRLPSMPTSCHPSSSLFVASEAVHPAMRNRSIAMSRPVIFSASFTSIVSLFRCVTVRPECPQAPRSFAFPSSSSLLSPATHKRGNKAHTAGTHQKIFVPPGFSALPRLASLCAA